MKKTGENYRPAIDGMRAVAVLAVVIFHIDAKLIPGGFVGVDIFFVISGFLISRNILCELSEGRFSLADFYRRRIKRIAPALLFVLAVTVVAAQLLLTPADAERAAESALWSLLSIANVYFWAHEDTAYFAASSAEKPLLHLWSLAVEEQFYVLWPLALVVAGAAIRRTVLLGAIVAVGLLSFSFAALSFPRAPSFAYFMLPSRAGELLVGAAVALLVLKWPPLLGRAGASAAATLGAVLMAVSLVVLNERVPFPGWAALLPTIAAALIIYADHCDTTWVGDVLSSRPAVWIGLLSYSAYLWHWPLLAFWRYGYGAISPTAGAGLFAATLFLAWLSYRWIESPARRAIGSLQRIALTQLVIPAGAIAVLCLWSLKLDGYTFRPQEMQARRPAYNFDYVCQRGRLSEADFAKPKCVTGANPARPSVLLWGDSNAAHYVGLVSVFGEKAGFAVRNVAIESCPPIDADPSGMVGGRRLDDCRASLALIRNVAADYPVHVLGGAWTSYPPSTIDAVMETARHLAAAGHLVILLGKTPVIQSYDSACDEKSRMFPGANCLAGPVQSIPQVDQVNARLRQFAAGVPGIGYFDVTGQLCPSGQCLLASEAGIPNYVDSSHITMAASWRLGREIAERGVPEPFLRAATWGGRRGVDRGGERTPPGQ